MSNIQDYKFSYNRISPIDWAVKIITPDGVNISTQIRCGPNQPPDEAIFNALMDKNNKDKFIIELEEIKPAPVKVEEIIQVIPTETETKPINNNVVYES
jgi:hypothetical protein